MKKLVLMVVAIAAISFASTGFQSCGGNGNDSDSTDSVKVEAQAETPAVEETPAPTTDSAAVEAPAEAVAQ